MSFFEDLSENAYEFFELIKNDLAILAASIIFCVVGSLLFPKKSKSKLAAHGPLPRIRKTGSAALSALGLGNIELPFRRRSGPPPPLAPLGKFSSALDTNGLPLDRNREGFAWAIREAQSRGASDETIRLVKEMQREGLELPASLASRMFRDLNPTEACSSLRRLKEAGVTLDLVMYNSVLSICVQAGDMRRAHGIGQELRVETSGPDIVTFCTMLRGCHVAGDLPGAKDILQEMLDAGHRPREISYNSLINAAVSQGDFQIAWDILEMMKKAGVPADVYTVSIMMKTLRQRNSRRPLHSKHAPYVFEFLDESGVDLCSDEVLLTTVVDTCVWHKEFDRVERILESYFASSLRPSVPVYASLVKSAKCIKRMDLVWKLWREAVDDRELVPSHMLIGCMLDALVCSGGVDKAVEIFEEWKTKVPPTTVIYSTLAKGFLNAQQPVKAMDMLKEMRENGVPRSTVLYNMVIGVHASQGALDKVEDMMSAMAADGCTPDIITYSTVVKSHCMKGDLDAARGVLRQAQGKGIVLDAIVYSSIIYGCYRHNRHDLIDGFVEDMQSADLSPSGFTLSIIVKMYGGQGRLDCAFKAVAALSRQPATSDARVAAALLSQCTRNSDLNRAEPLFRALLTMGGPDAKTFWPLVICCVRKGEHQKAQNFLEGWLAPPGRQRDASKDDRVERLLRALQHKRGTEALPLLDEFRKEANAGKNED